jgi:hypothetical protein
LRVTTRFAMHAARGRNAATCGAHYSSGPGCRSAFILSDRAGGDPRGAGEESGPCPRSCASLMRSKALNVQRRRTSGVRCDEAAHHSLASRRRFGRPASHRRPAGGGRGWHSSCLKTSRPIIAVSLMSAAFYNEMYDSDAGLRPHYRAFAEWLDGMPAERLERKRAEADTAFHRVGITFAVYGEEAGTERLIPFDIIPRIIPADEWRARGGLRQRVQALNAFLHDIYHDQDDPQGRLHPAEQVLKQRSVPPRDASGRRAVRHLRAHRRRRHRAGGRRRVLRARRQPAGAVGRVVHARGPQDDDAALPRAFRAAPIAPVEHYPDLLLDNLRSVAPKAVEPTRPSSC